MFSDPASGALWITTIFAIVALYVWVFAQREWRFAHWPCQWCGHGKNEHAYGESVHVHVWPQDPVACRMQGCRCRAYSPKRDVR